MAKRIFGAGAVVFLLVVWTLIASYPPSPGRGSVPPSGGPAVSATLHKAEKGWRPVGGPEANSLPIRAEIDPKTSGPALVRFVLYDISHEPGWCMNAGRGTEPDLEFASGQAGFSESRSSVDGFVIESLEPVQSAEVVLQARDSGAFGRLRAEVNIDGRWQPVPAEDGKPFITIPRDDNENHIADFWEEAWGVSRQRADEDRDGEPSGLDDGDGFSNYEEYRGFVMAGRWSDTDPGLKDIFVVDAAGFGVGYFVKTGLAVHFLGEHEISNPAERVVNFNRGTASAGPQKAVLILGAVLPETLFGRVEPAVGTPNDVDRVLIDPLKARITTPGSLSWALAHLLGHTVNMTHHGDFPAEQGCGKEPGLIGLPRQVHSGDADCVMRYAFAFPFYDPGDGECYAYPVEDAFGTDYCRSSQGTGINGGPPRLSLAGYPLPMAGNNARDACRSRLALKGNRAGKDGLR